MIDIHDHEGNLKHQVPGQVRAPENRPVVMTHCGQLGDFIYAWPAAAWYHKMTGRKIHWVLPRPFGPFRAIESLLMRQVFSAGLTLVDYQVEKYGPGGQPYKFNPWTYLDDSHRTTNDEYFNLGLRGPPDKFVPAFIGEEHGFGWDPEWVLNIDDLDGQGQPRMNTDTQSLRRSWCQDLFTEHANFPKGVARIDMSQDVLYNVRLMAASDRRHCWHSAMAVILYFARMPFNLYRDPGHPPSQLYFPDRSRYLDFTAGSVDICTRGIHPSHAQ